MKEEKALHEKRKKREESDVDIMHLYSYGRRRTQVHKFDSSDYCTFLDEVWVGMLYFLSFKVFFSKEKKNVWAIPN